MKTGYVYITGNSELGRYKIGLSARPNKRMASVSNGVPFPMETVAVFPTGNMRKAEVDLHTRFASRRLRGEWFELTPAEVSMFRELEASGRDFTKVFREVESGVPDITLEELPVAIEALRKIKEREQIKSALALRAALKAIGR